MGCYIHSVEYYLPKNTIDNVKLSQEFPEWEAEKILAKIGINSRHIAAENETALDLAYNASQMVLENFDRKLIDFVLLCTQSPDYFLPSSACILQDILGLRREIGAFDYNLGCSGYIYGLALAKSLIQSGLASNVLLIMAETYSKHIHSSDKSNRSIFGDGAAATIVSSTNNEQIHEFELGTDGKGSDNLIVRRGGMRPCNTDSIENYLYMNGPEIFNFTLDVIPDLVERVLLKNNLSLSSIDYCIFHQANKFILEYLRKKMRIDPGKFYLDMLQTGNTVSVTIPIALKDCYKSGLVKSGDKVLLVGFGVGYSWGATIISI